MIRLGELVAAILNELSIARIKGSLFGAQMAADFRNHALLGQLPIPTYTVSGAEVSVPFAIAKVRAGGVTARLWFEVSNTAEAIEQVTRALTEEQRLEEAFSLYDDQAERWRREVAPAITERLAAEAAEPLSIEGMSRIYGYLTKTLYLIDLVQAKLTRAKVQESVQGGYPDLVDDSARRLLKEELERISSYRERGGPKARGGEDVELRPQSVPMEIDLAAYVDVEATELKDVDQISILKLQLEEGLAGGVTFSTGEEVSGD